MSDRRVITDFVTPFVVAPSTLSPIITGYNGVKPPFTTVVNDISASPSPYFHGSSWEAEEDVEAHNLNLTAVLPLQTPPPPSTMRICLWAICVVGIVLNSVVLRRNTAYSKKRQNSTMRNSLQLLCFMAAADTISLAALMLALSTQYLGVEKYNVVVTAICKLDLFLIHSASAFSIWCWLVLSVIRYLAVYRPYSHLKLNREPLFTALLIFVTCCMLELWILYDVTFIQEIRICGETLPDQWGKSFQLAEILWSYFVPLTLITVFDVKVLCCHSSSTSKCRESSISEAPIVVMKDCSTAPTSVNYHHKSTLYRGTSLNSPSNYNRFDGCGGGDRSSPPKKNMCVCLETLPLFSSSPLPPPRQTPEKINVECRRPIIASLSVQSVGTSTVTAGPSMTATPSLSSDGRSGRKRFAVTAIAVAHMRVSSNRRAQKIRILKRCLCISILDLGMNLPNYLVRLYLTFVPDDQLERINNTTVFLWLQDISQLLYFAQFSLNALYLVCIIYVSPIRTSKYFVANSPSSPYIQRFSS